MHPLWHAQTMICQVYLLTVAYEPAINVPRDLEVPHAPCTVTLYRDCKPHGSGAILVLLTATAYGGTVTLTKDDVASARDIEAAIVTATNFGSEAGVVILDGSSGAFTYTEPDKSINIFVSNLDSAGKTERQ